MSQLKIVPRLSISAQARRAIAEYRAELSGRRRLMDEEVAHVDDLTIIERVNGEITIDNHRWQWQMNWKTIMDCKAGLNLSGTARSARESGYRFFAFQGCVYFLSCRGMIENTGLTTDEIDRNGEHP